MPNAHPIAPTAGPPGPVVISVDEVANGLVQRAVAYWRSLCGARRFPARSDLTLRGLAAAFTP